MKHCLDEGMPGWYVSGKHVRISLLFFCSEGLLQ